MENNTMHAHEHAVSRDPHHQPAPPASYPPSSTASSRKRSRQEHDDENSKQSTEAIHPPQKKRKKDRKKRVTLHKLTQFPNIKYTVMDANTTRKQKGISKVLVCGDDKFNYVNPSREKKEGTYHYWRCNQYAATPTPCSCTFYTFVANPTVDSTVVVDPITHPFGIVCATNDAPNVSTRSAHNHDPKWTKQDDDRKTMANSINTKMNGTNLTAGRAYEVARLENWDIDFSVPHIRDIRNMVYNNSDADRSTLPSTIAQLTALFKESKHTLTWHSRFWPEIQRTRNRNNNKKQNQNVHKDTPTIAPQIDTRIDVPREEIDVHENDGEQHLDQENTHHNEECLVVEPESEIDDTTNSHVPTIPDEIEEISPEDTLPTIDPSFLGRIYLGSTPKGSAVFASPTTLDCLRQAESIRIDGTFPTITMSTRVGTYKEMQFTPWSQVIIIASYIKAPNNTLNDRLIPCAYMLLTSKEGDEYSKATHILNRALNNNGATAPVDLSQCTWGADFEWAFRSIARALGIDEKLIEAREGCLFHYLKRCIEWLRKHQLIALYRKGKTFYEEANLLFQSAFLPDDQRDAYCRRQGERLLQSVPRNKRLVVGQFIEYHRKTWNKKYRKDTDFYNRSRSEMTNNLLELHNKKLIRDGKRQTIIEFLDIIQKQLALASLDWRKLEAYRTNPEYKYTEAFLPTLQCSRDKREKYTVLRNEYEQTAEALRTFEFNRQYLHNVHLINKGRYAQITHAAPFVPITEEEAELNEIAHQQEQIGDWNLDLSTKYNMTKYPDTDLHTKVWDTMDLEKVSAVNTEFHIELLNSETLRQIVSQRQLRTQAGEGPISAWIDSSKCDALTEIVERIDESAQQSFVALRERKHKRAYLSLIIEVQWPYAFVFQPLSHMITKWSVWKTVNLLEYEIYAL